MISSSKFLKVICCKVSTRWICSSNILQSNEINIPKRIHRGPTDILKAIASTVGRDKTAAHYKYHDDPYFTPISNLEKRTFALSKEAGKKAAKWFRDKHSELFDHHTDDPIIKPFKAKTTFTENSSITQQDLDDVIYNCQVTDAITVYNLCKSKNIEVSHDTKLRLLELVSFYNCIDELDPDWQEEKRTAFIINRQRMQLKSWKDDGFAEELFNSLKGIPELKSEAYSAIICGRCAYNQVEKAWALYQEMLSESLTIDTKTYNALIGIQPNRTESHECWAIVKKLLLEMADKGVPPNLATMNKCLYVLSIIRDWRESNDVALRVLNEFASLGIQPSLASFYHILKTFYKPRSNRSNIIESIIEYLEKQEEFVVKDVNDTFFFFTAMTVCNMDLKKWVLARRLHVILMKRDNIKFLGENIKEHIYYRNYMNLAALSLPIDEFMKVYDELVPNMYSPESVVMVEVLKTLGVQGSIALLPRIWTDVTNLEHQFNEKLADITLMIINDHDIEKEEKALKEQLINIAWNIWTNISGQDKDRHTKLDWTGPMLGECLSILVKGEDHEKSQQLLVRLVEKPEEVIGEIPEKIIAEVFELLFSQNQPQLCLNILEYTKDSQIPLGSELATKLRTLDLTDKQKYKLNLLYSP